MSKKSIHIKRTSRKSHSRKRKLSKRYPRKRTLSKRHPRKLNKRNLTKKKQYGGDYEDLSVRVFYKEKTSLIIDKMYAVLYKNKKYWLTEDDLNKLYRFLMWVSLGLPDSKKLEYNKTYKHIYRSGLGYIPPPDIIKIKTYPYGFEHSKDCHETLGRDDKNEYFDLNIKELNGTMVDKGSCKKIWKWVYRGIKKLNTNNLNKENSNDWKNPVELMGIKDNKPCSINDILKGLKQKKTEDYLETKMNISNWKTFENYCHYEVLGKKFMKKRMCINAINTPAYNSINNNNTGNTNFNARGNIHY